MRILVASHTYIVDLNCEKLRLMAALEPDVEVTIVVPRRWRPGGVQNKRVETRFRQEGSFQVVPVSNFSENKQGLLFFGADIVSLLQKFRPDIIQVEQGSKALAYFELITLNRLLRLNAKNVFFTWWNLPYDLKFPASWLENYNLRHTHGLIVGNQDGAEILQERGYRGATKVMPQLGVDEKLFCPQLQPELAAQVGVKPHEFVVGFVGRFVPEKGLLTLLKAVEKLGDRPWRLLLLGRGPLKQTLMDEAVARGIGDRVIWVESVPHDDVPRYINLMNCLVLPSETDTEFKTLTTAGWKEQFGHVLIEAMACQIPVVGSDSGEIPHVIKDGGLIFPEGNVVALSDCLAKLIDQPELARDLAQRGYSRAMTHYTNLALAKQQLEFYKQILGNRP